MGDRLTKEIRLELNAIEGNLSAFSSVSSKLEKIEQQLIRIRAIAQEPINLKFTSTPPTIPGSLTGGGTGGFGGGVGTPPPTTPPSALPSFPPPSPEEGFDVASARRVKTVITELADGTRSSIQVLQDARGNTQSFNTANEKLSTTINKTRTELSHLGSMTNIDKAFKTGISSAQEMGKVFDTLGAKMRKMYADVGQSFNVLGDNMRQYEDRLKTLQRKGDLIRMGEAFSKETLDKVRQAGEGIDALGVAHRRSRAQWVESNRVLEQNKVNLQALAEQGFTSVGKSIEYSSKGLATVTEKFQTADGRIAKINYTTGQFSMQMEKAATATKAMGDTISHTVGKVFLWALSTAAIYAPLRAIAALKDEMIAVDYQSGRLQRVFAGTTSEFQKLRREAVALSGALGIVPSQAIETAVSIARLQENRVRTLEMLRVALLAQNTAELTVEESLKFTTAAILQFNLTAFQAIRVLDAWNELSNTNRVLTRDLGEVVSRAGAAFAEAGGNIETLNAYTTTLAQTMGQTGSMIGTALKTMATYAQAVKRAGQATQLTGVQIYDTATESVMPIGEIIARLAARFDALTDAERNNLAQAISGVRRRTQLLILLKQYPDAIRAMGQQYESVNSAIKEQEVVGRTLQFQLSRLGAEFKDLGVAAGEGGLLGVLKTSVTTIRLVVGQFGSHSAAARILAAALTTVGVRMIINEAIYIGSQRQIKGMSAAVGVLTTRFRALAAAEGAAAAATSFVGGFAVGVVKLAAFMAAIYAVSRSLDFLYTKMGAFDAPTSLEDRLQAIQERLNKFETLKAAESNIRDILGALEEISKIELSGGDITPYMKAIRESGVEYIRLTTGAVYSHDEIIERLKTEVGIQELLNSAQGRTTEAGADYQSKLTSEIENQKAKVADLTEGYRKARKELEDLQTVTLTPIGAMGIGISSPIYKQVASAEKLIKELKDSLNEANKELEELRATAAQSEMDKFNKAQKDSTISVKEFTAAVKEQRKEFERKLDTEVKIQTVYAVDELDKLRIETEIATVALEALQEVAAKVKLDEALTDEKMAAKLDEISEATTKLKDHIDDLNTREIVVSISDRIKDDINGIKDALDFKIAVSDVFNPDSLSRAQAKYELISNELGRINDQLRNAEKTNLDLERITALRTVAADLEKDKISAARDIQLERLSTEVSIAREMQKQNENAEKAYLFADREAQAKAKILELELQRRGGKRLPAEEFAQLSPDTKKIIQQMVPGLLPVEALSDSFKNSLSQIGSKAGTELGVTIPDIIVSSDKFRIGDIEIPFGPNNMKIEQIPVPASKFVFPDIIVPSDKIAQKPAALVSPTTGKSIFDNPSSSMANAPITFNTAPLQSVFDGFITRQEKITTDLIEAFSQVKQAQVELDVDVDFGGVQGPLNNLVTKFTSIVEGRLNERLDEIENKLTMAAKKPTRPNVNAEAL